MFRSYLKVLIFIVLVSPFSSCSNEEVVFIESEDQERVNSNSKVISLMKEVVSSYGSYDNVVDGSSNLTVILPISVVANSVSLSLEKPEDFTKISDIHLQNIQDRDYVTPDFPIRVILPNHKIRTVGSQSALDNLVKRMNEDEELPLGIQCVDIVYPTTVSVLNQESGIIEDIILRNDEEYYVFLDNLDVRDLVGITFPLFYELADGSQFEITNFVELEFVFENIKESCLKSSSDEDENDPADENEEDETEEQEDDNSHEDDDQEDEDEDEQGDDDQDDDENSDEGDDDDDDEDDDDDDEEDDDDDDDD